MQDTIQSIHQRLSANNYDSSKTLTEAQIRELITDAGEAPSSFNIQHWRFIAVTDEAAKQRLKAAAWGQEKVGKAPATFIVLGDLQAHHKLAEVLSRSVKAGVIPQQVADSFVQYAHGMYDKNPQLSRDEAIRSASLAAMTLMLAAQARGLATGPMIGFDPDAVKKEFHIPDRYVVVMLMTIGPAAPGNWPRKPRLAADEILFFNDGAKLEK